MGPIYTIEEVLFINEFLKTNIIHFFLPCTYVRQEELIKDITKKIQEHKGKIIGDDGFSDSGHTDIIENLIKLKKILFCGIEELPLLLNDSFPEIVNWRFEIGK